MLHYANKHLDFSHELAHTLKYQMCSLTHMLKFTIILVYYFYANYFETSLFSWIVIIHIKTFYRINIKN